MECRRTVNWQKEASSYCWLGKVHARTNGKLIAKDITINLLVGKASTPASGENRSAKVLPSNSRSGKIRQKRQLQVGPERSLPVPSENRLAMLFRGIKQSVGKDMSVGKRLSRLDLPQQTLSVGNILSRPTVCR